MQYLLKTLSLILFLIINFNYSIAADEISKTANLIILDKTSSTKYKLDIIEAASFRDLNFEIISCKDYKFEKYTDKISLIKINNNSFTFIGWFFSKTEELNTFSNKIYEIKLVNCN